MPQPVLVCEMLCRDSFAHARLNKAVVEHDVYGRGQVHAVARWDMDDMLSRCGVPCPQRAIFGSKQIQSICRMHEVDDILRAFNQINDDDLRTVRPDRQNVIRLEDRRVQVRVCGVGRTLQRSAPRALNGDVGGIVVVSRAQNFSDVVRVFWTEEADAEISIFHDVRSFW